MVNLIKDSKRFLKLNGSTILTGIASIGIIATSIMTAKATVKAVRLLDEKKSECDEPIGKMEIVKITAPIYMSSFIMGASTIACILSANSFNRRQQASLISAYALANNSYKKYRNKVKELYGEETDKQIIDSIAIEKAEEVNIYSQTLMGSDSLLPVDCPTNKMLFYDEYGERFFESTIEQVVIAEYHLNRNFVLGACLYLNDFYELLGLEKTDYGESVGWILDDGLYWVEFNHRLVKTNDMEYINIEIPYGPTPTYEFDM